MTPLHIQPLPDSTPDTVQKIDALNRKLGSFIHAPLNLKEVLRMEPFAADAEVARAVAATLDDYSIIPTSPEEREGQPAAGLPKDYDIVRFWYCVALLALSAEPAAVRYLLVLARMLMVEDPAELYLLRRTVRLLEGFPFPHLQELRSRIEAFYDTSRTSWRPSGGWKPPGFRGPSHTNGRSSRNSPPTASPMPIRRLRRRSAAGAWC